jgi:hypothetical protein
MAQTEPKNGNGEDKGGRPPKFLTKKDLGPNKDARHAPRNLRELGERLAMVGDAVLLGLITPDRAESYVRIAKQCQSVWGKTGGVEDLTPDELSQMSDTDLAALEGEDDGMQGEGQAEAEGRTEAQAEEVN